MFLYRIRTIDNVALNKIYSLSFALEKNGSFFMHDRHTNKARYFKEQGITTEKYIIPYLSELMDIDEDTTILEIGCGEGGNLKPFLDMGCKKIVGIDLSNSKIELAKSFYSNHPNKDNIDFIADDIYNIETLGQFDLLITKDVIEHIHGQERFLKRMQHIMKKDALFFLGFPPWYNPFGGHQQMCRSKILSKLPYFHLLPNPIYKGMLKLFGEKDDKIANLLEIKETGISIERFQKVSLKSGYKVKKRTLFFINPNYEVKFNLKPRIQSKLIAHLPFVRNFFTTACYFVLNTEPSSNAQI